MKKVRYMAGVVGALGMIPALALTAPGATAATRAPTSSRKTVSLLHTAAADTSASASTSASTSASNSVSTAGAGGAPCTARHKAATSPLGDFVGAISFSRDIGCIGIVFGRLHDDSAGGLDMRVRSYINGVARPQRFNTNGVIHRANKSITWSSYPRTTGIGRVCEAIVLNSNKKAVVAGPVCEDTGF
jgi:hypothetical protein